MQARIQSFRRTIFRGMIHLTASPITASASDAMIIAPHPDDEVLGCGGLIAMKKRLGASISVVFLTSGEAAHAGCCSGAEEDIAAARKELAAEAARMLGLDGAGLHWLGMRDSGLAARGVEGFRAGSAAIRRIIEKETPAELFVPHAMDGWPDHRAAAELIAEALQGLIPGPQVYYYPVWMWQYAPMRSLPALLRQPPLRLDISAVSALKQRALDRYLSALSPSCGGPYCGRLPDGFRELFLGQSEFFFRAGGRGPAAGSP